MAIKEVDLYALGAKSVLGRLEKRILTEGHYSNPISRTQHAANGAWVRALDFINDLKAEFPE